MALLYYPRTGEIVLCKYPETRLGTEMIKPRPCIIFAPRLNRRGDLYTVVPFSTTPPNPIENWHCQLNITERMPKSFPDQNPWIKGDMIDTVAFERLDRMSDGKRKYKTVMISQQDLEKVRNCVKAALGFL